MDNETIEIRFSGIVHDGDQFCENQPYARTEAPADATNREILRIARDAFNLRGCKLREYMPGFYRIDGSTLAVIFEPW